MRPTTFLKSALAFFYFVLHASLQAQVCTGSLGDPSVNINFGTGANPGPQLSLSTTTYNYTTTTCPNDGSYTIVNSSIACFGNTWHSISEDHTPNDQNGYMMLVNASFNPGDFYVDTVKNLCGNTTYEFAAWILNVLLPGQCSPNPILPELIFNIETVSGTVLGTYSTKGIPSTITPTWIQHGLFFKTPVNASSVVIRLTNTAPGGCGNDIALDDITFRPCGPVVMISAENDQTNYDFCVGQDTGITWNAVVGSGYVSPAFQWQLSLDSGLTWADITGANTTNYVARHPNKGVYEYRLVIAEAANIAITECRVASNVVTITTHDRPVVSATNDGPVCENHVTSFTATGGVRYEWNGPGNFSSQLPSPSFITQKVSAGVYNVSATDQFGCTNNASTVLVTKPSPNVTVSNNSKICEGDSALLTASGGSNYAWYPEIGLSDVSPGAVMARPVDSITYFVVATNDVNCTDTGTVTVNVVKAPTANAGEDKALLKGSSVVLNGEVTGTEFSYYWSPSMFLDNNLLLKPTSTPTTETKYTLHVNSNEGCGQSNDEMVVKVFNDIYIPSAFSPNNDGLNDTWNIHALAAFPNATVRIFNRYGQIVFESISSNVNWNGMYQNDLLPAGAYPYLVDLKNDRPILKGMLMLIR